MNPVSAPADGAPRYADTSRAVMLTAPGRVTASSAGAGWTSLLLVRLEKDGGDVRDLTEYETRATPDQTLVMSLGGDYDLECFRDGAWRRAAYQPGLAGLTPGGMTNRLRWRARAGAPIRTLHLFLPGAVVEQAAEHYRRAGAPYRTEPLNALAFRDPAVTHAVLALARAMEAGAPDLYAAAVSHHLATHLLSRHAAWPTAGDDGRTPGLLADRRLARVVEYMSAHFHEPLTLERLAAEGAVSKFHFARLFKAATGEAPHAFLVRLRMRAARQMLRDTDRTAAEVAAAVGYADVVHFARVFRRATGRTPIGYRDAARGT